MKGNAHKGDGKRITTNRQTLKSGGSPESYGNNGNTKSTTLPSGGKPTNSKAKSGGVSSHMSY